MTDRIEVTAAVAIGNVAVVVPAGTLTDAGTTATDVRPLDSATTIPAAGAGPFRVTVPTDGFPPFTLVGSRMSDVNMGAATVKVARRVVPRYVADILGDAFVATGLVVAVKVAVLAPANTVTDAGTWAAAVLLDVNVTTAPPTGA